MAKRKRKKRSKKKLNREERLCDAKRYLCSQRRPKKSLIEIYTQRYGVSESDAWDELMYIGYYEELCIEGYEREGIEWEYMVEPLSGDMFVVPKDTQPHEIYAIHHLI